MGRARPWGSALRDQPVGALLLLALLPSAQICLGWCQSGSVLEDKCPAQLGVLHAGRCFPERLMLRVGWSWHPEVCIHRSAAGVWLLFLLQEHLWALWGCTGGCYCSTAAPCSARVCHHTLCAIAPPCAITPCVPPHPRNPSDRQPPQTMPQPGAALLSPVFNVPIYYLFPLLLQFLFPNLQSFLLAPTPMP